MAAGQQVPPQPSAGCPPAQNSSNADPAKTAEQAKTQPVAPQPVPYESLTPRQKLDVFFTHTYSPYTMLSSAFDAGLAQGSGDWYSYGGGMEGYGKRFGASLANNETGAFFGRFLYPTMFHQDPRYQAAGRGGTTHRAAYAASRVLVTKNDARRSEFNISRVLASLTAAGVANAYYPREERGIGDTFVRMGYGLLNEAGMDVLREFWPDIKRKLVKRQPQRIKRLGENPKVQKLAQEMTGNPPGPPPCQIPTPKPQPQPSR
jgi:hypothetical protein